jgi:hypothetical protein
MATQGVGDECRDGIRSRCVMNREEVYKRTVDQDCNRRLILGGARLYASHGLGLVESP